ncbi:hypothetical protein ACFL0Q_03800 [Thermodesulfobacteriota bacterium]
MAQRGHGDSLCLKQPPDLFVPEEIDKQGVGCKHLERGYLPDNRNPHLVHLPHATLSQETSHLIFANVFHRPQMARLSAHVPSMPVVPTLAVPGGLLYHSLSA